MGQAKVPPEMEEIHTGKNKNGTNERKKEDKNYLSTPRYCLLAAATRTTKEEKRKMVPLTDPAIRFRLSASIGMSPFVYFCFKR